MAVSETNSIHTDWLQYHQHHLSHLSSTTESTVVTTTSATPLTLAGTSTGSPQSIIEGRVGKSARKRSRASRKAPTTLLNTDTANFRAMVQQFTGAPSAQFPPTNLYQPGGPTLDFELGVSRFRQPMIVPFGFQQQQQNQQYQQLQEQQQRDNDVFLHGFLNNPRRSNHEILSDGFLLDSISSQTMADRPSSADNGRASSPGGGFML